MAFSRQDQYSTPLDDFERTRQNAYSHGLEKIYALENVDIRSIRKIGTSTAPAKPQPKKNSRNYSHSRFEQLELPFDFPFKKTMDLLVYREPLQVIGFSKRIESWLLGLGKRVVGDLLESDRQSIIRLKGIGQGHLDEINEKLQSYLDQHVNKDSIQKERF